MSSSAIEHADFQEWAWCLSFLLVYRLHPTPEGIARAWTVADEARKKYAEREVAARARWGNPVRKKHADAPPQSGGKAGVKRRKR